MNIQLYEPVCLNIKKIINTFKYCKLILVVSQRMFATKAIIAYIIKFVHEISRA